ncbi:MAG: DUF6090 family protein [bacterium]|nr:DUF6090 family protein [bacterium]
MLRFFRNIRQKLLENGNLRKYFWYALGEILLVMIGILLALQINNWNEDRKVESDRISLLQALKMDHQSLLDDAEVQLQGADHRRNNLKQLLAYSAGEPITISDDSVKTMLRESMMFYFSEYPITSYEQAKSSGKLSLIQNQDLLLALSKNEENLKGLKTIDVPVLDQEYSEFMARIEMIKVFDELGNYDWSPELHPDLEMKGEKLVSYLRSADTYVLMYHIYGTNNIISLWWGNIQISTQNVLAELSESLNDR